jgi:quinol-cytochrome oxidoreductase complex cytochrome b subunit
VGSNISAAVPLVGNKIHFLLLGGHQVDANALLRFYVLHCLILPFVALLLVAVHFWRIRKDGGLYVQQSEPKKVEAADEAELVKEAK